MWHLHNGRMLNFFRDIWSSCGNWIQVTSLVALEIASENEFKHIMNGDGRVQIAGQGVTCQGLHIGKTESNSIRWDCCCQSVGMVVIIWLVVNSFIKHTSTYNWRLYYTPLNLAVFPFILCYSMSAFARYKCYLPVMCRCVANKINYGVLRTLTSCFLLTAFAKVDLVH